MNEKEYKIIDSFLQELLGKEDYTFLHQNFENVSKYQFFLQTLLEINIDKKKEPTLFNILDLYGITNIYLGFKNKKNAIIEELAELYFNGETTNNISYLNETKNVVFLNHLQFLKDTAASIKLVEREALKKKLLQLNKLNAFNLEESEIKIAFKLIERKRLKKKLQDLDIFKLINLPTDNELNKQNLFESDKIKRLPFTITSVLKYAAIFIILIGAGYLVYTGLKQTPQLAKNEKVNKPTVDTIKKVKTQPEQDLPTLSPATEINYSTSVLQEQNFGFSSANEKTISIKIIDVTSQLKQIAELKSRNVKNDYLKNTEDSLLNLQGTYLFEKTKNKLTVYTDKKLIKVTKDNFNILLMNNVYYLNIKNDFYGLEEYKTFIKLKVINDDNIIEKLSLLKE